MKGLYNYKVVVDEYPKPEWEFGDQNNELLLLLRAPWLHDGDLRKWLQEHCKQVYLFDFAYEFPDIETKTEFLLRWS